MPRAVVVLRADGDRLAGLVDGTPGLDHLARSTPPVCTRLRLEDVPVGHEHPALGQQRHQVRRHQVAGPVEARLACLGVELARAGCGS